MIDNPRIWQISQIKKGDRHLFFLRRLIGVISAIRGCEKRFAVVYK